QKMVERQPVRKGDEQQSDCRHPQENEGNSPLKFCCHARFDTRTTRMFRNRRGLRSAKMTCPNPLQCPYPLSPIQAFLLRTSDTMNAIRKIGSRRTLKPDLAPE